MTTEQQNNLVGMRFSLDVNVGGTTVPGTVTINGNYEDIAWGELRAGQIVNFHTFYVKYANQKPEQIEVNHAEIFLDRSGSPKPAGSRQEVEALFNQLVTSRIEAQRLKEIKKEDEARRKKTLDNHARRQQEIMSKKKELREQLARLSEGLDVEEALKNKEIIALTAKINTFNLVYGIK